MVVNLGKALGGDWGYVEADVKAVCDEAHKHGAKVKVIFENDYLTNGGAGLSSDDFNVLLRDSPVVAARIMRNTARELARRLRRTSEDLRHAAS